MLHDELKAYIDSAPIPMHMPGHKRNPDLAKAMPLFEKDITEVDRFDSLLHPAASSPLEKLRQDLASLLGYPKVYLGTNGSTGLLLSAIRACCNPGEKIILMRNCHVCCFNAAEAFGLETVVVDTTYISHNGVRIMPGAVSYEQIEKAIADNLDAKAMVLVTPTYEGVISRIDKVYEMCKASGIKLIVDAAHGAHLGVQGAFINTATGSASSMNNAGDMIVMSLHKTLLGPTSTAVLALNGNDEEVSRLSEVVDRTFTYFQTSSPSFVLMEGVSYMVQYMLDNQDAIIKWEQNVLRVRKELLKAQDSGFVLLDEANFGSEELDCAGENNICLDPSKLVIISNSSTDFALHLKEKHNIELEAAFDSHLIAMTGLGDSCGENLEAFRDGLLDSSKKLNLKSQSDCESLDASPKLQVEGARMATKTVSLLKPNDLAATRLVPVEKSVGLISAKHLYLYPPGIPIVLRGEVIDEERAEALSKAFDEILCLI